VVTHTCAQVHVQFRLVFFVVVANNIMIHEPPKKGTVVNAEIDEECLIWLDKVFHVVITLETKGEYMY